MKFCRQTIQLVLDVKNKIEYIIQLLNNKNKNNNVINLLKNIIKTINWIINNINNNNQKLNTLIQKIEILTSQINNINNNVQIMMNNKNYGNYNYSNGSKFSSQLKNGLPNGKGVLYILVEKDMKVK